MNNTDQLTEWAPKTELLKSQWGQSDYFSWCNLEAKRWCDSGRPAFVQVTDTLCALFKGVEMPRVAIP